MKRKLAVPDNRPLADFLPTLTILAKGFAAELATDNKKVLKNIKKKKK